MNNKQKLSPGSYAIIKWSESEPETICEILGYRGGMMIIRTDTGQERVINSISAKIIRLKEVANERY